MRRAIMVLWMMCCAALAACDAPDDSERMAQVDELDLDSAHAVYVNFSPTERVAFWRAKFERALRSGELSPAQTQVVLDIQAHLEESLSGLVAEARNGRAKQDEARLREVMSEEQLQRLFGTIGNPAVLPEVSKDGLGQVADVKTCNASGGCGISCWCAVGRTGGGLCLKRQVCTTTCGAIDWTCGFLGLYACSTYQEYVEVPYCAES